MTPDPLKSEPDLDCEDGSLPGVADADALLGVGFSEHIPKLEDEDDAIATFRYKR